MHNIRAPADQPIYHVLLACFCCRLCLFSFCSFNKHYQNVKRLASRSGPTFCRSWYQQVYTIFSTLYKTYYLWMVWDCPRGLLRMYVYRLPIQWRICNDQQCYYMVLPICRFNPVLTHLSRNECSSRINSFKLYFICITYDMYTKSPLNIITLVTEYLRYNIPD